MNAFRLLLPISLALTLAGCGAPTVPDFTYFRLPRPQPLEVAPAPLFGDIVIDAFGADGLFGDQALIYALDPGAQQLRQFHYQLWTDPPTRTLQRRLIEQLRDTNVAAQVTDELPASHPALRISGVILRFDRVRGDGRQHADVAMQLRVEHSGDLLFEQVYRASQDAAADDLNSTVQAFGAALDRIYGQFLGDLAKIEVQRR